MPLGEITEVVGKEGKIKSPGRVKNSPLMRKKSTHSCDGEQSEPLVEQAPDDDNELLSAAY